MQQWDAKIINLCLMGLFGMMMANSKPALALSCPSGGLLNTIQKFVPTDKSIKRAYLDEFGIKHGAEFQAALDLGGDRWWLVTVGQFHPEKINRRELIQYMDGLPDALYPEAFSLDGNKGLCIYRYTHHDGFKRYIIATSHIKPNDPIPSRFR